MNIKYLVEIYQESNGNEPFSNWFTKIDNSIKKRVIARINRVKSGNFGDHKNLKDGVFELKFKSGHRIYYGKKDEFVIILLLAGNKSSQKNDIKKAKEYWQDYKNNWR